MHSSRTQHKFPRNSVAEIFPILEEAPEQAVYEKLKSGDNEMASVADKCLLETTFVSK